MYSMKDTNSFVPKNISLRTSVPSKNMKSRQSLSPNYKLSSSSPLRCWALSWAYQLFKSLFYKILRDRSSKIPVADKNIKVVLLRAHFSLSYISSSFFLSLPFMCRFWQFTMKEKIKMVLLNILCIWVFLFILRIVIGVEKTLNYIMKDALVGKKGVSFVWLTDLAYFSLADWNISQ